jgi:hypothetical protein
MGIDEMRPVLTGTGILMSGKNAGKPVKFKIFQTTPKSAVNFFAKNVLIDSISAPKFTSQRKLDELEDIRVTTISCCAKINIPLADMLPAQRGPGVSVKNTVYDTIQDFFLSLRRLGDAAGRCFESMSTERMRG